MEAEALSFRSTVCVEHHFTDYGQSSRDAQLADLPGAHEKLPAFAATSERHALASARSGTTTTAWLERC